jgi:aryl-alcohol dehydrogenase-like predicted oxidoreductase
MMQYSLLDRRPEEILPLLHEKGIGVLARGSIAQGLLANKPARAYLDYSIPDVEKAKQVIEKLSVNKRSRSHVAIQFVLSNPSITSAIVGFRTTEQLSEAITSLDSPGLSGEEMELLTQSIAINYYKEHR